MATRNERERERLQPALLDRLTDEDPLEKQDHIDRRSISRQTMRDAILRDLGSLFNAVRPNWIDMQPIPHVASSVLNYGMPPLAGALISRLEISKLEMTIKQAIITYEPRILANSLKVKAQQFDGDDDMHNRIWFSLSGMLWAQPVPLEFVIRTELDLETGQIVVRDRS
jgi:type VI secretion system protein ImpF